MVCFASAKQFKITCYNKKGLVILAVCNECHYSTIQVTCSFYGNLHCCIMLFAMLVLSADDLFQPAPWFVTRRSWVLFLEPLWPKTCANI